MMEQLTHNEDFLKDPERQSPVAILLILFKFIGNLLRQAWPFVIVLLLRPSSFKGDSWTLWAIGLGSLSTLASIVAYFKFYYYVKDEELIIEKGLFQKTRLNIPFDRIQTINFRQNPIHRFFNVVSLDIDTAGSKGKEFSITALDKVKAETIRSFLIAHIPKEKTVDTENEETLTEIIEDKKLIHLSIKDLLKIGVGQNHLRGLGIIFGTAFTMLEIMGDADSTQRGIVRQLYALFDFGKTHTDLQLVLYAVPLLILFLLISSFVMTIFKYYDLRFLKTTKGFKVITGLFNRREQSASMQKIQMIRWSNNPLKKIFALFDLRLLQASSSRINRKQAFYIPGIYDEQLTAVRESYFPGEQKIVFETHHISKRIIFKRFWLYGILPMIPGFFFFNVMNYGPISILWWLWLPLIIWTSFLYHRNWRYHVSEEGIRTTKGIFGRSHTLLKWTKIQGARLQQSIFQARRGYTDLQLFTAAGTIVIPYIEEEKARKMIDFALYKVESSQVSWM